MFYDNFIIAEYDCFKRDIMTIVWDVTSDRDLALRMCQKFNRYQLSPIHLEETVIDMLTWQKRGPLISREPVFISQP